MPRAQDEVERVARDRLHWLMVPRQVPAPAPTDELDPFAAIEWPRTGVPAAGEPETWVPEPPAADDESPAGQDRPAADDESPAGQDRRAVAARLRSRALVGAATAYTARHGHPLEHPNPDARPARRWQLSVRLAVVAGVAIAVLGAGVAARATFAASAPPVSDLAGEPAANPDPTVSARPSLRLEAPAAVDQTALLVHVVGQVLAPGVVQLPAGSRVLDAVAAAGGAATGADLSTLNLARVVVDGEQIVVPAPGEVVPTPSGAGGSDGGGTEQPVDLNSAGLADLDALPGIGPVLAQRILDWRAEHGRFTAVDELGEVPGIGDTLLGRLRDLVRV